MINALKDHGQPLDPARRWNGYAGVTEHQQNKFSSSKEKYNNYVYNNNTILGKIILRIYQNIYIYIFYYMIYSSVRFRQKFNIVFHLVYERHVMKMDTSLKQYSMNNIIIVHLC